MPDVMTPLDTCQERIHTPGSMRGHICGKKAWALGKLRDKEVPLCRIHHPEERERRRQARGPTRWERRRNAEAKRAAELERLSNLEAKYKKLVEACKIALDYFVEYDIQNKVISGLSLLLNEALTGLEAK